MHGGKYLRPRNANAHGLPTGVANPVNNPRVPLKLWGARQGQAARGRGQGAREGGQGGPASCKLHGKVYTTSEACCRLRPAWEGGTPRCTVWSVALNGNDMRFPGYTFPLWEIELIDFLVIRSRCGKFSPFPLW